MVRRATVHRAGLAIVLAVLALTAGSTTAEACYICYRQNCWVPAEGTQGKRDCSESGGIFTAGGYRPSCTLPSWARDCTAGPGGDCDPEADDKCGREIQNRPADLETTPNGEPSPAFEVDTAPAAAVV